MSEAKQKLSQDCRLPYPNEDIKKVKKILGNLGIILLGLELIRFIFRPYGKRV